MKLLNLVEEIAIDKRSGNWKATMQISKKNSKVIGVYPSPEEAATAYDNKVKEMAKKGKKPYERPTSQLSSLGPSKYKGVKSIQARRPYGPLTPQAKVTDISDKRKRAPYKKQKAGGRGKVFRITFKVPGGEIIHKMFKDEILAAKEHDKLVREYYPGKLKMLNFPADKNERPKKTNKDEAAKNRADKAAQRSRVKINADRKETSKGIKSPRKRDRNYDGEDNAAIRIYKALKKKYDEIDASIKQAMKVNDKDKLKSLGVRLDRAAASVERHADRLSRRGIEVKDL